jgi:hypothetical protein
LIPGLDPVETFLEDLWDGPVLWTGAHILRLEDPIPIRITGSGDTLYQYVRLLLLAALTLVGTLLWSLLARWRSAFRGPGDRLAGWLRIGCRYYLGTTLTLYGLIKVIKSQFPFPDLVRLTGTYGDSSPMGLLWNLMGYSEPYNLVTGGVELLGGCLLFFRRTTTLGALVCAGAMINVVLLNFSYDVPVKLFSTHLFLFAALLAARDLKRLLHLFVLNRPSPAADLSPPWPERWNGGWRRWSRWAVKALLVGSALITAGLMAWEGRSTWGDLRPRGELYGLYDVERFTKDGVEHPPLLTDTERWRLVIVDRPGLLAVRRMDNTLQYFTFEPEEIQGGKVGGTPEQVGGTPEQVGGTPEQVGGTWVYNLTPRGVEGDPQPAPWTFTRTGPDRLSVTGQLDGSPYTLELRARELDEMLLLSRGFHWINEVPFNR